MTDRLSLRLVTQKYREFLLPTLAITMANNLAVFADTVLVSVFLGVSRMPAVQLCFPVVALLNFFQTMFGIGGSLLAANAQADHDRERGDSLFSVSVGAILGIGCVATLLGNLLKPWIVSMLCSNLALRDDVAAFFGVLVFCFPAMCLLACASYFVRADGCAKLASRAVLVSNGVNLLLDCVFMKGLGLGLAGSALATTLGYYLGTAYLAIAYAKHPKRQFRLNARLTPGTALGDVRAICTKGSPTASVWLYLLVSVQTLNNLILGYGGQVAMQAYSICKNSLSLANMFFLGASQTMQPIVGVYAHEGDYRRSRYILVHSIKIVLATALIMAVIFAAFPQLVIMMYGAVDVQSAEYFRHILQIYGLALPGIGISLLMNYYFQAIDKKGLSAALTALEALLPAGLAFCLARLFQTPGIWAGLVAGELVSMLAIVAILFADYRRSHGERIFMLPRSQDATVYEFSVPMDTARAVEVSEEASTTCLESGVGRRTATIVCLALEEMLTGIVMANAGRKGVVDVSLACGDDSVTITIKDMGVGYNPLVRDPGLDCHEFDNAAVLKGIASEIAFDLSLGMNVTTIRLDR